MVDSIRSSSDFARQAVEAARRNHERLAQQLSDGLEGSLAPDLAQRESVSSAGFDKALDQGLKEANAAVQAVDRLPGELLTGGVTDLHEVALRLKESELSYRFALEVRNKLIDAYREVMRMGV